MAEAKKVYCSQISKEQYEEQSRSYTEQMLQQLADTVRRNPELTEKTAHFSDTLKALRKKEAFMMLPFVFVATLVVFIVLIKAEPFESADTITNDISSKALCPSDFTGSRFWAIVNKPPFVIASLLGLFLLWITSMQLENMLLQLKLEARLLQMKVLVDFCFFPLISLAVTVAITAFGRWAFDTQCVPEMVKILDNFFKAPGLNFSFKGYADFIYRLAGVFKLEEPIRLFLMFYACIYVLISVLSAFKNSKNLHSIILISWVLGTTYLNFFELIPAFLKNGQWIALVFVLSHFVDIVIKLAFPSKDNGIEIPDVPETVDDDSN